MSLSEKTDNPALKNNYLFELTQFRDPTLIARAIDYAFTQTLLATHPALNTPR